MSKPPQEDTTTSSKVSLTEGGVDFDKSIYGTSKAESANYVASIAANDEDDDDLEPVGPAVLGGGGAEADPFDKYKPSTIADRIQNDEYKKNIYRKLMMSPSRTDPFKQVNTTPGQTPTSQRGYADVMAEQNVAKEKEELLQQLQEQTEAEKAEKQKRKEALKRVEDAAEETPGPTPKKQKVSRWDADATPQPSGSKSRWEEEIATPTPGTTAQRKSRWDDADATPTPATAKRSRWDDAEGAQTPTPATGIRKGSRWDDADATPTPGTTAQTRTRWDDAGAATPTPGTQRKSRWDDAEATPTPGTHTQRKSRWDDADATPTPATQRRSRWDDADATPTPATQRRSRWDDTDATPTPATKRRSRWDDADATPTPATHRRSRWDDAEATPTPHGAAQQGDATPTPARRNRWDEADATPTPHAGRTTRWGDDDATPTPAKLKTRWDDTPGAVTPNTSTPGQSRWAETPMKTPGSDTATPRKSRWDETPSAATPSSSGGNFTPMTPGGLGTPTGLGPTPMATDSMQTPLTPSLKTPLTPEMYNKLKWKKEIDERNRPLSDQELDEMLPTEGYKILEEPDQYKAIHTPARKLAATPTPHMGGVFSMQTEEEQEDRSRVDIPKSLGPNLPDLKPEDYTYFSALLEQKEEDEMTPEELRDSRILKLLLKVKNGTPPQRKQALRQITDKAREFGAGPLFDHILPLLMSPTLEDQERHLVVKVIDRILYKLDDMVRPFVHKILVVIEPLLIDEDYYARVEGREIISNLSKAAGLATMIATMRPDIDNKDEYVRNVTARAFAVVASALGIPSLIPFLKAVCQSKKSWEARHTGIKIVQQIAILMGCAVLPHLKQLVEIIHHGLTDEQQKVRTITALALAALAEAAAPYGIEAFDCVLKPLWTGIHNHRGKGLAAFLKAIGYIIPLMDTEYANYYTREVMDILIREFRSPDEEMKKIVLKVVKQCVATEGVEKDYVKVDILPQFFRNFWVKRMALDRRNYKQLVDTTVEIAKKIGPTEILARIVDDLKDENEAYRRMVMETIEQVVNELGAKGIEQRLEEQLIDGILYAFQEQTSDDNHVMLNGFGTIVNALETRVKEYLPQIGGVVKWRLNNKNAKVRQQTADLVAKIAKVMQLCGEEPLLGLMGQALYEFLGEEYPEVLGSILHALKAVVNVIGMSRMTPPIKDLLPRLTPILKNRHEKVQENCIDLVGRIADRGAEYVPAREWMRICIELLELLKAHKKAIRRAAVNTFGYIAKAIGPSDVLVTLLNNLKVQERQNRVCTTVAIAIVAETCSPFTVLPALMNEYRVPELNVQHGVLKALSFMFEYIGEMTKDYIYSVTPLIEDALTERDLVHRQMACVVVKHLGLSCVGLGCEDSLMHLLNYVWPNIFETSPHVINAVFEAIEGLRTGLGVCIIMQYILQGLYHPARKVREVYWKAYNNIYIGNQAAMVAFFPRLENDSLNRYTRDEMDMVL